MRRRGFTLLAVLWTIAAVTALLAVSLGALRDGDRATQNRIRLTRARWAAEACIEIAHERWSDSANAENGSEPLGRDTRCRWRIDDPFAALSVNEADSAVMAAAFVIAGMRPEAAALWVGRIARRRAARAIESISELEEWPGFPGTAAALLTVEGDGRISSQAPASILLAVPGLTAEAVQLMHRRRLEGRPVASLDELTGLVSPVSRTEILEHRQGIAGLLVFEPPFLRLTAAGAVGGGNRPLVQSIELLVVRQSNQLAILRRRLL